MWKNPELTNFLRSLANHTRVILFDKRGTGLSDRVTELSTLEERMDDIRAVMDAVGSQRAILFGHSEGGSVSALFAATYPQRTVSLITFGVFAKRAYAKDYPWAPTSIERQKVYDMIETSWGTGHMDLVSLAPSKANDAVFMEWLASYFRSGASPTAALVLTKMNTNVDIIDILDTIEVPTLLLYRTDDIDVKVEEGRFIANRIQGSRLVEFPGSDHLFWVGDAESVLDSMLQFISVSHEPPVHNRVLATILKMKVAGLDKKRAVYGAEIALELQQQIRHIASEKIAQYRGRIERDSASSYTATFDGPSKAVHCAMELRSALEELELSVCQAIHIGECVRNHSHHLGGRAIKITDDVMSMGSWGEILITQTVQHLLSGAGIETKAHDVIQTPSHRKMEILAVKEAPDQYAANISSQPYYPIPSARNHSFLENVLQSIEDHLGDELYSIQVLCREVGVSERHLQRKLKSITNKSPNQLIRSVRLHRAKELILQDDRSISEIAYHTGFNSLSYFTKCFKKEFGVNPSSMNRS